jgi:hypothetical protein
LIEEVLIPLCRHSECGCGDILPEDAIANDLALKRGGRLFLAYGFGRHRFWIMTEPDRSLTSVLLAEDGCWHIRAVAFWRLQWHGLPAFYPRRSWP